MSNPLVEVMKLGQSIWYDNIRRAMLTSGDLQKKIDEDDLRGVTSNPTIFEKAITGSTDYDEQMRALITAGKSVIEVDGQTAGDLLAEIDRRYPGFRFRIINEQDGIREHIKIFVNEDEVPDLNQRVHSGDVVHIICGLSGGVT